MAEAVLGNEPAGRRMVLSRMDSYTATCCPLHTATCSPDATTPLMATSVSSASAAFLYVSTTSRVDDTCVSSGGKNRKGNDDGKETAGGMDVWAGGRSDAGTLWGALGTLWGTLGTLWGTLGTHWGTLAGAGNGRQEHTWTAPVLRPKDFRIMCSRRMLTWRRQQTANRIAAHLLVCAHSEEACAPKANGLDHARHFGRWSLQHP